MDDSCAVCAEALEWVAYGPCGHREVCSTCVVRLRFICDDRRCCICKTESNQVFVTKALGDYTRVINDFSVLPTDLKEGRVGQYWYHEDTQTVFDDLDHYKMIQAMCKLSCSVCDMEENDGSRRRIKFKNVEQLKGHLYHQHRLIMCSLCLEGRKVFICEQKLYSRTQLNQHINSGDSEVDGTESERGGFMGHPLCEFCKTPFYGDNELYSHMSTEHYTCHICQRQHPGQYEYYKNYDDLEIHFRRDHFLCEDEACLGKKFVVFQSEAEMKRHNALEHGGNMSRSKRIAALQIPTSFRYQRSNEQDNRQGRRRSFRRESSEDHLSMAIQASYETGGNSGVTGNNASSSSTQAVSGRGGDRFDVDLIVQPFESLAASSDTDQPTRYRQAVSQFSSGNAPLEESSFPPLPAAPRGNHQQNPKPETRQHSSRLGEASFPPLPAAPPRGNHQQNPKPPETQRNTMAANLSRKNKSSGKSSNPAAAAPAWPAVNRSPTMPSAASPSNAWPAASAAATTGSSSSSSGQKKKPAATNNGPAVSSYSSLARSQPVSSHVNSPVESSSARRKGSTDKINHSTSAPNLGDITSLSPSSTDFPPVAVAQARKLTTTSAQQVVPKLGDVGAANKSFDPSTSDFPPVSATTAKQQGVPKVVGDVHSANKSLVERIRMGLEFDESKYTEFKEISGKYRQGLMDAESYLAYVYQYGLSHLVIELARLCPDTVKQKELIDTYNYNAQFLSSSNHTTTDGGGGGLRKGKGKSLVVDEGNHHSKTNLADSIMNSVRNLQSSYRYADDEEVEVLSKDGYRAGKGKLTSSSSSQAASSLKQQQQLQQGNNNYESHSDGGGGGGGKSKQQRKKTSKFHRVRLGDGSVAALLDLKHNDSNFDEEEEEDDANKKKNVAEGGVLPVRGVWKNGGGQRLMGKNH